MLDERNRREKEKEQLEDANMKQSLRHCGGGYKRKVDTPHLCCIGHI